VKMGDPFYAKVPPRLRSFVYGWARGNRRMAAATMDAIAAGANYGSVRKVAIRHGVNEWTLRRWRSRCLAAMRSSAKDAELVVSDPETDAGEETRSNSP